MRTIVHLHLDADAFFASVEQAAISNAMSHFFAAS
jgi:hypothetical protein